MALMLSAPSSGLVCVVVLCVTLLPSVWASYCPSYWDEDGNYHDTLQCGSLFCCDDCRGTQYCCTAMDLVQFKSKHGSCPLRSFNKTHARTVIIVVAVLGAVIPVILCVAIIVCCLCPCCLIYKKCRKRRNQRGQIVIHTTNVTSVPDQPPPPQPSYPGYQPVPIVHGYGGPPIPTAPPTHPYLQAGGPGYAPGSFPVGQPVHPLQHPGQSDQPPPYSDELKQPPFNPSYGTNP